MAITEAEYIARLRDAMVSLRKMRSERDELLRAKTAPIAIVGAACRFPGGGDTPDAYWKSLVDGVDAIRPIVPDRFSADVFPEDKPSTQFAAILDNLDQFDAEFFGISPREAELLDPQQRLLLEVTWEALENAGIPPVQLKGSKTGVFVGITNLDYQRMFLHRAGRFDIYGLTGNMLAIAAGRLSFILGLQGPAVAMDTACSSALVAIHLGCQSLRNGECDAAIVGGVNALFSWEFMLMLANMQALSPDGRCKTFDARANGYVRAEGCGMFVLKRLADAQRDGDTIWGLVKGSAVNQDGRSTGLTTPNVLAQEALLRQAVANAGASPSDVTYIETHGTGTPLGDPIEFDALRRVYGKPREDGSRVVLGAVKTNVGHLESAAGTASLMKALLAFRNDLLPKNLHFSALNPRIDIEGTPFLFPVKTTPWPRRDKNRLAGISSFGLSGTNAHIIVEENYVDTPNEEIVAPNGYVLPLSAKTPDALDALVKSYVAALARSTGSIFDISYSASVRRMHHEHRLAVVGKSREDIVEALEAITRNETPVGSARGECPADVPNIVFVFSGQGSQWAGMGQQLLKSEPVFREALLACDEQLAPFTGFSVIDELNAPEGQSRLGETFVAQPAIFAIEVALAALVKSWGITPSMVIGHSVGEIAAAHVAGILDLNDAARLVAVRGRMMQEATGHGKMAAIGVTKDRAQRIIEAFKGRVAIAAVNEYEQTVISGEASDIDTCVAQLNAEGISCRPLRVNYAFHSPQMDRLRNEFVHSMGQIPAKDGTLPLLSTVTGDFTNGSKLDIAYWGANIRETVRFVDAIEQACNRGNCFFVEIGPHPVLTSNIAQILSTKSTGRAMATLRRSKDEQIQVLAAIAEIYAHGYTPTWTKRFPKAGRLVALPNYPWQRKRHWAQLSEATPSHAKPTQQPTGRYALGGVPLHVPGETLFQLLTVGPGRQPYLHDHVVHGHIVVPGAFYVATLLAMAVDRFNATAVTLRDVVFVAPLVLKQDEEVELHVTFQSKNNADYDFAVLSYRASSDASRQDFQTHVRGQLALGTRPRPEPTATLSRFQQATWNDHVDWFFKNLSAVQVDWGPRWRWIHRVSSWTNDRMAAVAPTPGTNPHDAPLHPILIDNGFAVALVPSEHDVVGAETTPQLPFAFKELRWFGSPLANARILFRAGSKIDSETTSGDLTIVSDSGEVVCEIDEFVLKRAQRGAFFREVDAGVSFVQDFQPMAAPIADRPNLRGTRWLLFGSTDLHTTELQTRLEQAGATVSVASMLHGSSDPEHGLALKSARDSAAYLDALESASQNGELSGILCWWNAFATPLPEELLPAQTEQLALAGLHLVRAFSDYQRRHPHATSLQWLWFTENAQPIEKTSTVAVELASLWGLGRVVQQEHPEFRLRLIDLELSDKSAIDAIEEELACNNETQVVRRRHGRFVPRLIRLPVKPVDETTPTSVATGTVLITGGLGALGLRIAHWLWQQHRAGNIVLLGRTAPSTVASHEIALLRESGAKIMVVQADVADARAMADVIGTLPDGFRLRGIVHAAGVLEDGILAEQTDNRFSRVFAPKVRGAWNLHLLTREIPLDFFILFSSVSSLSGNAGQSNYAAANAFLDGLAHARRSSGLAALAVNWGPWADGGMASNLSEAQRKRLLRGGMGILAPDRALAALNSAMLRSDPQIAIFALEMAADTRSPEDPLPPLWRALIPTTSFKRQSAGDQQRAGSVSSSTWLEQISQLSDTERRVQVELVLCKEAARVLGLASPDQVHKDRPLQSQGLDSLMAVELRTGIATRIGKPLPATLVFNYPTVRSIVNYLLEQVLSFQPKPAAAAPAPIPRAPTAEPIAIVGMGCRYPGGIHDAASFWKLLEQGGDAIRVIPRGRWDVDALYNDDPAAPGKMYTREAGMLENVELFDPAFFGISAREATWMDPQQRLLLETTWEALENGGIAPETLMQSDTGVFVGLMYHDYALLAATMLDAVEGHASTGTTGSVASGRISYALGLQGPSMTVDTACSSSLVTLHLACRSLRSHECSMALAGGVALMLTPLTHIEFSRLRGLAPDGRCKSFDASANGVSWSEGCGMFVLKRLSDAQRSGDRILAIIRGSAVNQDGRSNGLTAPNGPSQEIVIQKALADAGLDPSDIDYIEGHGTGTPLGDPIEVQALGTVFGSKRSIEQPVLLGSVKSNLGHTQSAAGAAGVMKVVLSLQHQLIPRSLHFRVPNPHVDWSRFPLKVVAQALPWMRSGKPRRAGVSSFGLSGTNAHIILEEAPATEARANVTDVPAYLLPLSAKTPQALVATAAAYAEWFAADQNEPLSDIVYTASLRRTHHEHRIAAVARSPQEFADVLGAFGRGEAPAGVIQGRVSAKDAPRFVFVFSGQGSQWAGMAKTLLDEEPVFRAKVEQIDTLIRQHATFSVLDALRAPEQTSQLDHTEIVQPALFALQVGLVELFKFWGIVPHAVMGHSIGEVAAAHISGALSLEDAVRLVVLRGRIMQKATGLGKMVWVALPPSEAKEAIAEFKHDVAIAAVNDPTSVVLSGHTIALEKVIESLHARHVATRPLRVNYAFHSPQMDTLAAELVTSLGRLDTQSPTTALYSTVTGTRIRDAALEPEYWGRNVRDTVQFATAVQAALDDEHRILVEIGPHPVLVANIEQCAAEKNISAHAVPTLRRHGDDFRHLLQALGALHTEGIGIDWQKLLPPGRRVVSLPTYRWQRERYWIEPSNADMQIGLGRFPSSKETERRTPRDPFASCIFEVAWQRLELPTIPAAAPKKHNHWLVLMDTHGLGATLSSRLRAQGDRVTEVSWANEYVPLDDASYRLDPTNLTHWERLLASSFGKQECHGILCCAAVDCAKWDDTTAMTIARDLRRGPFALVRLVQAVMKQGWRDTPRLYVLTRGAQAVGSAPVPISVAQSTLWGLGRVIAMEYPDLGCVRIDLGPDPDPDEPVSILRELQEQGTENQIAMRSGERYVARLARGSWGNDEINIETSRLQSTATYLITGGLGGLGLSLAKWMVTRGARHLVLVGRSSPNATAQRAIHEMESAGASVHALQANIVQRADVDTVLAHIDASMPPLRGIVHAAAVLADRTLAQMNDEEFFRTTDPKVLGAWNLHDATRQRGLDFFIVYSSIAGLLGSPGQANYAAANTFLDALCRARQAQGLAGTSIQWGPFADVGMAAADEVRGERLAARGHKSFTPEDGHVLFERALAGSRPELALMHFDVRQWIQFYPQLAGASFLADLMRNVDKSSEAQGSLFRDEIERTDPLERSAKLTKHVLEQLGRVLRVDPSKIDKTTPFTNLGMDSLMSLELRNRFESTLGIKLSAALLFTYPTTAILTAFLLEKIEKDIAADDQPQENTSLVPPSVDLPLATTADDDTDDLLALFDASAAKVRRENLK